MGTLIARNSAADSIFSDLANSVIHSTAKGGKIAELANAEVVPMNLLIGELDTDLTLAKKLAAPLSAMIDVTWQKGCNTVRLVYDLVWNHVGRPAFDPKLSLLFPTGASHYIEGSAAKLPERLELLAQLFEKGIHPKLSKDYAQETADKVRLAAMDHSAALEAARIPTTKVAMLERTRTAMAQSAHSALANFKRLLKVAGFTEAQIHEVVPNRPRPAAKKAAMKRGEAAAVVAGMGPGPAAVALAPAAAVAGAAPAAATEWESATAPAPVAPAPMAVAAAGESAIAG